MSKEVIVIGTGGHGRVIADIVQCSGDIVKGFLDDAHDPMEMICGIPVLGHVSDYVKFPDAWFVIGIGSSAVRHRIAQLMEGVKWYTAVHPTAIISKMDTAIGEGTVIMPGAVVNVCSKIGRHCIINTAASVDHDNRIGDFTQISVGARLAGTVTVGSHVWVGIGAVVSNNLSVCDDCYIGAGAVIVKDITDPGTYAGVPARKMK